LIQDLTPLRVLALAVAFAVPTLGAPDTSITVSAAISLTEVLQDIAKAYAASGGGRVAFNLGGSNALARQIVNGAPVDVFISADAAQMAVVERAGMVSPATRLALLGNQLAIVVRRDRAEPLASAASLADASVRRIAIGDPDAVPAGVYAKQYLERIGLWNILQPKLLPSGSVRAALAAVEHGGADAGIVYLTDIRASTAVRLATAISGPEAPAIVYPACVVESSRRKDAAAAFLKYLRTSEATRLLEQYGFLPLASAR
jgi:molybdate transport system substrate-binding protein